MLGCGSRAVAGFTTYIASEAQSLFDLYLHAATYDNYPPPPQILLFINGRRPFIGPWMSCNEHGFKIGLLW
jgi:hypothetical protein